VRSNCVLSIFRCDSEDFVVYCWCSDDGVRWLTSPCKREKLKVYFCGSVGTKAGDISRRTVHIYLWIHFGCRLFYLNCKMVIKRKGQGRLIFIEVNHGSVARSSVPLLAACSTPDMKVATDVKPRACAADANVI